MIPAPAVEHYAQMQRIQALGILAARRAWATVDAGYLSESWTAAIPALVGAVTLLQTSAAERGGAYGADTLAAQGLYQAPDHFINPAGFAGAAPDGRPLDGLLYAAVPHTKGLIADGMAPKDAVLRGRAFLEMVTKTTIADAGRSAAGVDTAARKGIGYVRMLNPPSCARCSVMAGKFYRWNTGFLRHPKCDCVHVQTTAQHAAKTEGLLHDPYAYFHSLPAEEQDRAYTASGAQAIRDGADIFQVVNARRGLTYAGESKDGSHRGQNARGAFTTEGITRRGNFANSAGGQLTRGRRMTPDAIYKLNGDNREAALADLAKYGYILPGGQNPLGSITGQREGFGALGHGGAYSAARKRVEDAIANGRDPAVRATMTEAERRLFDAKARWELVQQGINPYAAPSMTPRAKTLHQPLTPEIAASVEKDYRRWLSTGGQIFN